MLKTKLIVEERAPKDQILNETNYTPLTLENFIDLEFSVKDQAQMEQMIKTMKSKNIFTLNDLSEVKDWSELSSSFPAHYQRLQKAVERYRKSTIDPKRNELAKTEAELMGDWNKVKLFLLYEANLDEFKRLGFIDKVALKKGFEEQRNDADFDGGPSNFILKNF